MEENTKRIIRKIVIISVVIIVFVFVIDYFNICGMVGIKTSKLNVDYLSIIVGNVIVVSLFVATYYIVDSHGLKKEKNKRNTALIMLKNTYIACQKIIDFFDNKENRTKVADKSDFEKMIREEPIFLYYQNRPFNHDESVLNFSVEGIITPEEYDTYLKIQSQYKDFVSYAIAFYDNYYMANLKRTPLIISLEKELQHLLAEVSK